jgi:hypothetical protein
MDKENFSQTIFGILQLDEELSGGEKFLVNEIVGVFVSDYRTAIGEDPIPSIPNILLFAPRLKDFGFKMPLVDGWMKEYESYKRECIENSRLHRKER